MEIPEYVTVGEVRRICRMLGIRDWTRLKQPRVTAQEAKAILAAVGTGGMKVDLEEFRIGLEVELEHGTRFPEANVTNNHPLLTGKIVLAHFKETLDYYKRLEVAEIEGDLLKASAREDAAKVQRLYQKLICARRALSTAEVWQLSRKPRAPLDKAGSGS
jgi:hypothetical protein